jgi:hypothetical protein
VSEPTALLRRDEVLDLRKQVDVLQIKMYEIQFLKTYLAVLVVSREVNNMATELIINAALLQEPNKKDVMQGRINVARQID